MQAVQFARILKLCALAMFVSTALAWARPVGPATAASTDQQVRQVASLPIENPAPLENGRLAFQRSESGSRDIYVLDAGGLHNLTNGEGVNEPPLSPPAEPTSRRSINLDPAFSSDGSKIAFLSNRHSEGDWELYVMNADGSGVARITNTPGYEGRPAWSPDGTKIAYHSNPSLGNSEIYVINAGGGGRTNLSNHPAGDGWPTWSPDGTKIAFATGRDGNAEVYVMNADGSDPTNLTNNPADDGQAAWSPDGSQIAFVRTHYDGVYINPEIYVMNADGSGQTRLTDNALEDAAPAWSPDGSKIAFMATSDPPPELAIFDIHVMNADGSGRTKLTDDTNSQDKRPSWAGPPLQDSDGDGCSDAQEVGSNPAQGGMRDPSNFWDFTDQWVGGARDRTVNGFDIGAVVIRFGSAGDPDDDPLDPPTTQDGYHVSGDRSPPPIGLNSWNAGPADGTIDGFDIASVIVQFGHTCA